MVSIWEAKSAGLKFQQASYQTLGTRNLCKNRIIKEYHQRGWQNDSKCHITVKPQFTGPLGGKELGPVNRDARYIRVDYTLIYTQSFFWGIELRPGKSRDPVNRCLTVWRLFAQ